MIDAFAPIECTQADGETRKSDGKKKSRGWSHMFCFNRLQLLARCCICRRRVSHEIIGKSSINSADDDPRTPVNEVKTGDRRQFGVTMRLNAGLAESRGGLCRDRKDCEVINKSWRRTDGLRTTQWGSRDALTHGEKSDFWRTE